MEHFFNQVLEELLRLRGFDLSGYRRSISEKRLSARMEKLQIDDPSDYIERLKTDPSECDHLLDTLLIKVSSFFRNPIVFEIISQSLIPKIIKRNRNNGRREIRVWNAGCASGEESYSIAILIYQALRSEESDWTPYIFATDISKDALKTAEAGTFRRECFENTKLGILDKYFIPIGDVYRLRLFIRKLVRFSQDDITSMERFAPADSVFGTFDLLLCRNVLIYFSQELQKRVFSKLYKAMNKGGFLILGDSESLNLEVERKLISVDRKNRIFQKPDRG